MLPPDLTSSPPPSAPAPADPVAPAEPATGARGPRSEGRSEGRKERNAAATKTRLLDAAEREFAARGFAGARLREIADGASVQPALIHHYFVDKHGLYRAVLDRAMLPTSTQSWGLLENVHDLEGLLTGFIDLLLHFYAAHQNLLSILRHEALSGSPVLAELSKERTQPVLSALSRYLAERQAAGELRSDLSAEEIIVAGVSLVAYPFVDEGMLAVTIPGMVQRDEAGLARRKQTILKLLLGAIRPPPR